MKKYLVIATVLILLFVMGSQSATAYYFIESPQNPITGGSTVTTKAYSPTVIKINITYHMWYGDGTNTRYINSTVANFSDAIFPGTIVTGLNSTGGSVFYKSTVFYNTDGWNLSNVSYPQQFLMYYTNTGGNTIPKVAVSYDGIAWTPVANLIGISNVYSLSILYESPGVWKGYADSGASIDAIQYYTSNNGVNWVLNTTNILSNATSSPKGAWEPYAGNQITPRIKKLNDGSYLLAYSSGTTNNNQGIGLATSTNGRNFTRDVRNPIFSIFDGIPWRNTRTYNAFLLDDGGNWKMYFQGNNATYYSIGMAIDDIYPPSQVTGLTNTTSPTAQSVILGWNASSDEVGGSGIKDYQIFIRNNSINWLTIPRDTIDASTSYNNYSDAYRYNSKLPVPVSCAYSSCHPSFTGDTTHNPYYLKYDSSYLYMEVMAADNDTGLGDDYVEIMFDPNKDGGAAPQTDDRQYELWEDGTTKYILQGNGTGWVNYSSAAVWSVHRYTTPDNPNITGNMYEVRIPLTEIGSPTNDSTVRFAIEIECTEGDINPDNWFARGSYFPDTAVDTIPDTWDFLLTYRNNTVWDNVGTSLVNNFEVTDLLASFRYYFSVLARDNALNNGLQSQSKTITTTDKLGYDISGYTIVNGVGALNSTVQTSAGEYIVLGNPDGYYELHDLINGTYNITSFYHGIEANPVDPFNGTITIDGASISNQNFTLTIIDVPENVTGLTNATTGSHITYNWNSSLNSDTYQVLINNIEVQNSILQFYFAPIVPHITQNMGVRGYNSISTMYGNWTNTTVPIPNNPISISNISTNYSVEVGTTLAIHPTTSDADSDVPTFTSNNTKGSFNNSTGALIWTPITGDIGNYSWNFSANDGYGSTAEARTNITIIAAPEPTPTPTPTATPTPTLTQVTRHGSESSSSSSSQSSTTGRSSRDSLNVPSQSTSGESLITPTGMRNLIQDTISEITTTGTPDQPTFLGKITQYITESKDTTTEFIKSTWDYIISFFSDTKQAQIIPNNNVTISTENLGIIKQLAFVSNPATLITILLLILGVVGYLKRPT